jgi:hypothetical protein
MDIHPSAPISARIATQTFVKASDTKPTSGQEPPGINKITSVSSSNHSSSDEIVYTARKPVLEETRVTQLASDSGLSDVTSDASNMDSDINATQFASSFLSRTLVNSPLDDDGSAQGSQSSKTRLAVFIFQSFDSSRP